jgi:hypothetical protein
MDEKTLGNADIADASARISDLVVIGDGDLWKVLCKASSEKQGWMKSTKALEIRDLGCLVQVTTQQRNHDGTNSVAEAVTFVSGAKVVEDVNGGRRLVIIGRVTY